MIYVCVMTLNSVAREDSLKRIQNRKLIVSGVGITGYSASAFLLNELWYKEYKSKQFNFFDDSEEWLQVDKFGHAFTCYQLGEIGMNAMKWGGFNKNKSVWIGGLSGITYMSMVELMDGFSEGWGFSWADVGANAGGSLSLILQEHFWQEQRIRLKFSYYPSEYAKYRPGLLGDDQFQKIFKDYNAQTFWLSVNIHSFLNEESKFPRWLNLAFGYGASGMTGGFKNPEMSDINGNPIHFTRARQFYFSLDADLSKIKTKSVFIHKLLCTLNMIKVPFPSIEFSNHKIRFPIH